MQDYEIMHIKRLRKLAPECMVLLKSDGSFPLTKAGEIVRRMSAEWEDSIVGEARK